MTVPAGTAAACILLLIALFSLHSSLPRSPAFVGLRAPSAHSLTHLQNRLITPATSVPKATLKATAAAVEDCSEPTDGLRVAIVGGGIGGLATAIALRSYCPEKIEVVDVYERRERSADFGKGTGLTLFKNGTVSCILLKIIMM